MTHNPIATHPAVSPLSAVIEAAFPRAARTPAECRFSSSLLRCCRRWAVATEAELLLALAADPTRAARCILSERTEYIEKTEYIERTEYTERPVRVDAVAAERYISALLRTLCLRRVAAATPVCPVSQLFSISCAAESFTTGCARLDALLCGGFRSGALTELHGEAGSGKTQLALQALVHAARLGLRGGVAALCLAAEDIPCARLAQLVAAQSPSADEAERVMAAVRIRRVAGLRDVTRMLRDGSLRAAFRAGGGRGVIVIDSIAAAAAHDSTDTAESTDSADAVADAGALLKAFAVEERAAVVATNQVRALLPHHRPRGAEGPQPIVPHAAGAVAPALGIHWAVAPHVRVRLRRLAPALAARQLTVLSGPAHPPLSGTFIIDKDGIRAEG